MLYMIICTVYIHVHVYTCTCVYVHVYYVYLHEDLGKDVFVLFALYAVCIC